MQIVAQTKKLGTQSAAVAHAGGDALKVAESLQIDHRAAAQSGTLVEFFNGCETGFELAQIEQRLRQGAPELARAHWCDGAIKHAQKATLYRAAACALQKFEVALGMGVEDH